MRMGESQRLRVRRLAKRRREEEREAGMVTEIWSGEGAGLMEASGMEASAREKERTRFPEASREVVGAASRLRAPVPELRGEERLESALVMVFRAVAAETRKIGKCGRKRDFVLAKSAECA